MIGKMLDGFLPLGPFLVTTDDIPDPQTLRIQCRVNGKVRQLSSTSDMILALSVNKCVLRRVPPDARESWHQDGAFLGGDIRTVDVWVALSDCGGDTDAPGLEIVPRRLEHVVSTDGPDSAVPYAVNRAQLADALDGLEPQMPTFKPGDALLFDHLLLHTTASRPGLKRERYALETWIFTPSTFPTAYVPLAL